MKKSKACLPVRIGRFSTIFYTLPSIPNRPEINYNRRLSQRLNSARTLRDFLSFAAKIAIRIGMQRATLVYLYDRESLVCCTIGAVRMSALDVMLVENNSRKVSMHRVSRWPLNLLENYTTMAASVNIVRFVRDSSEELVQ